MPATSSASPSSRAKVERLWPGATVVCVGAGPSVTQKDLDYCRGRARVIVVNSMYKQAPWADVLYAADEKWWRWQHNDGVPRTAFPPLCVTLSPRVDQIYPDVIELQRTGQPGLELDPGGLRSGGCGGYQAINLAFHLAGHGCRILLLGYDMQADASGRHHCHLEHPDNNRIHYPVRLKDFQTLVEPLRKQLVSVINCTRRTALTCFPQAPLRDVL